MRISWSSISLNDLIRFHWIPRISKDFIAFYWFLMIQQSQEQQQQRRRRQQHAKPLRCRSTRLNTRTRIGARQSNNILLESIHVDLFCIPWISPACEPNPSCCVTWGSLHCKCATTNSKFDRNQKICPNPTPQTTLTTRLHALTLIAIITDLIPRYIYIIWCKLN